MDDFLSQLTDDELLALYSDVDAETKNHSFVIFNVYNARDVEVLTSLDAKFKLMQLVNQMAHENTVPFEAILGTVRYVETGIMNRAHNVHKLICTNKVIPEENNKKVEGAIVMTPLAGLHEWLGSVDITSLYPSVIRALNMSVETFFGQFVDLVGREDDPVTQLYGEYAWRSIRKRETDISWTAETAEGLLTMTGAEWAAFIKDRGLAISAFGTLFDQSKPGMVADTLTFWFEERKRLQAEKKKYAKLAKEEKDPTKKAEYERQAEHYDLLQLTKKIQLNSTYGALLNEAFRFGRREIGASVTGTGRQITMHMATTIGTIINDAPVEIKKAYAAMRGAYVAGHDLSLARKAQNWDYFSRLSDVPVIFNPDEIEDADEDDEIEMSGGVYWTESEDIIYGDTDSCYFRTRASSYEEAVARADDIAQRTNATFPSFMAEAFNCTDGREKLIKAAREIVAERGLFLHAKKKYTLKVVNLDGLDLREKPKLKSMGSEIKKADTPKVVQDFLKSLMDLVLAGKEYQELEKFVNERRKGLIHRNDDLMTLGVAKQINNLDAFYAAWTRGGKKDGKVLMVKHGETKPTNVPGHVRAAINYNELIKEYAPGTAKALRSGDKGVVFYLKPNTYGFKTVAFPADMNHLPSWFTENFAIDLAITEKKMIDAKLYGIFEAMGQEVPTLQQAFLNSVFQF